MKSKPCEPSILVPVILGIQGLTGAAFLISVQLEGRLGPSLPGLVSPSVTLRTTRGQDAPR